MLRNGEFAIRAARGAVLSASRSVLLIIGGGIAAYKMLEVIRRLKDRGIASRCILTRGDSDKPNAARAPR